MAANIESRTESPDSNASAVEYPLDDSFQSDSGEELDRASDAYSLDLGPHRRHSAETIALQNNHPIRYTFSQLFGDVCNDTSSVVTDADMVSAVRFSNDSDMVAVGDKGGRIFLLKQLFPYAHRKRRQHRRYALSRRRWSPVGGGCVRYEFEQEPLSDDGDDCTDHSDDNDTIKERPLFDFWTQFQSHEKELDFLQNLHISESISHICWCPPVSGTQRLLVSNEHTIKLWRVNERDVKGIVSVEPSSVSLHNGTPRLKSRTLSTLTPVPQSHQAPRWESNEQKDMPLRFPLASSFLKVPRMQVQAHIISATPKRIYRSSHYYGINSISLNSDEETFISADDLRVNLYSLHRNGCGFNILYIQPEATEQLSELITCAEFHPHHCNILAYSNTQAVVKLFDLRESALCRGWAKKFQYSEPSTNESFFAEIPSTPDMKFSPDGQCIMTRDYVNLRLWDMRMERATILFIPVHEHLRYHLRDYCQSDCTYDKFQCRFSSDGGSLLTGSYNSLFQTYSAHDGSCSAIEAGLEAVTGLSRRHHYSAEGLSSNVLASSPLQELMDPSKQIVCLDASPQGEMAAVAAGPAVYFYYGRS